MLSSSLAQSSRFFFLGGAFVGFRCFFSFAFFGLLVLLLACLRGRFFVASPAAGGAVVVGAVAGLDVAEGDAGQWPVG